MPLTCQARKWYNRKRGTLDDVLGGYSLTYVDLLDTLAVLGYKEEFQDAISLLPSLISFERDVNVSVYLFYFFFQNRFETTIRILGGLLSAHQLCISDKLNLCKNYNNEILELAEKIGKKVYNYILYCLLSISINI